MPKDAKPAEKTEDVIVKVDKPNKEEHDAACDAIEKKIEAIQQKLEKIRKQIEAKTSGKDDFNSKKDSVRKRIDEATKKIDLQQEQKKEIFNQMDEQKKRGIELRGELQKMKSGLDFTSPQEIDRKVEEMEFEMMSTSMSLKEEKAMLAKIQDLKKQKPKLSSYVKMQAKQEQASTENSMLPLKDRLEVIAQAIKVARDEKKAAQAELNELNEQRKAQMADMPEVFEAKEKLTKEKRKLLDEKKKVKDAFNTQFNEWRAYQAQVREQRNKEWAEQRAVEDERRKAENKARLLEKRKQEPHVDERTILKSLISYCKSLQPVEEAVASTEVAAKQLDAPAGTTVLKQKGQRETDYYFAPTVRKGKKAAPKKAPKSKVIKHDLANFTLFGKFKVAVPTSTDDLAATIVALEKEMAHFDKKVEEWRVKRAKIEANELPEDEDEEEAAAEEAEA
jgi:uncharacterized coiled-coil DUF342 family protein